MITIFFRLLIIYIVLICGMKFVGKRQIGELEISELITTILLSELAALPIANNNIPIVYAIIPIIMLITFEIIITFITTRFEFLKVLFYNRPSFIIKRGELDQKEMAKIRLSVDEFISELRLKDIRDIKEVDYAILEQNGQLSVFPKSNTKDKKSTSAVSGIAHPVIIDGIINKKALIAANRSRQWLDRILKKKELKPSDIFIYTIDDGGNELLIIKQNGRKK